MIEVDPMPEELAIAHAGRMALFNGYTSEREFNEHACLKLKSLGVSAHAVPRLTQLAFLCGMAQADYARQHSLLPVLRIAARGDRNFAHGAAEGESFSKRLGMCSQRPGAYVCPQCVKEDLEHWHFSWFRRTHQIQGVDWCPTHRTPLARVTALEPWHALPQHWIASGEIEPIVRDEPILGEVSFEARLLDISGGVLQRSRPCDVRALHKALAERARQLGLRTSPKGTKPLPSDCVRACAPDAWLRRHGTALIEKSDGAFVNSLDVVVQSRSTSAMGFAYLVALAALFDSSEDALQFLSDLDKQALPIGSPNLSRLSCAQPRERSFWHGPFWDIYVELEGKIRPIATRLAMDARHIGEKLSQLGLPSLHDAGTAARWRAFLRFRSGESLAAACQTEGVAIELVEDLLRLTSSKVALVVEKAIQQGRNPVGKRSPGQQQPCAGLPLQDKQRGKDSIWDTDQIAPGVKCKL